MTETNHASSWPFTAAQLLQKNGGAAAEPEGGLSNRWGESNQDEISFESTCGQLNFMVCAADGDLLARVGVTAYDY